MILAAATGIAAVLLLLIYSFNLSAMAQAARALGVVSPEGPLRVAGWLMAGRFYFANGAGFALLLVLALVTYAGSRKARYFGNSSMLIAAVVLVVTALLLPAAAGFGFFAVALPFLLLFVTGIARELLDGRWAAPFSGVLGAALLAQAYFCLTGLWQLGR